MKSADVAIGLILAVVGAVVYFVVIPAQIPVRELGGFGVSFFPKLLLGLIILFSLLLAIHSSITKSGATLSEMLRGWPTDLLLLIPIPICYFIIRYLGLAVFAAVITPACMLAMGERRIGRIALVAACLAITTRVVIIYVLQSEPLGVW